MMEHKIATNFMEKYLDGPKMAINRIFRFQSLDFLHPPKKKLIVKRFKKVIIKKPVNKKLRYFKQDHRNVI